MIRRRIILWLWLLLFLGEVKAAASPDSLSHIDLMAAFRRLSLLEQDEVLWLARCIYSESNRPEEQRLIAWVVRNRVETRYRGDTYREVVLEPRQFSAFNRPTPRRDLILNLTPRSTAPGWQQALRIALEVFQAPPSARPFPITVRHFYSPLSMPTNEPPPWARAARPFQGPAVAHIDPERFQFFDGIDARLDPEPAPRTSVPARPARLSRRWDWLRPSGRIPRPVRPIPPRRPGQE
ncbi:cell wall hydrolase [Rhodothermus profundi]|uniref:Cell Wall Hydrolase n=1 Tax=Rhodothermus profundi TaxID=633813 RepID=A0A1M6X8N9_9BACT|nr:cell wall hydrolase [Rhodothermus profundi]SHL02321.1 Cell Wall Hydrolase [Rhodothermus profundi]